METNARTTAIGEPSGTMASGVDQATAGAHNVITKASAAARPAIDRVAAGAHQTVDKMAGTAAQAAGALDLKSEQIIDAQTRLTENCRVYVRRNPLTTLGIAVAAGFLVSWLLSGR